MFCAIIAVYSTQKHVPPHLHRTEKATHQCSLRVSPEMWLSVENMFHATLVTPKI
jgi:hypothetical protein